MMIAGTHLRVPASPKINWHCQNVNPYCQNVNPDFKAKKEVFKPSASVFKAGVTQLVESLPSKRGHKTKLLLASKRRKIGN